MMNTSPIFSRIKSEWKLKIAVGALLNTVFAALYLIPQHYPVFNATTMHITFIDSAIPFLPGFVYIYESLYLLMPVAPWLMTTKKELARYAFGILVISITGFIFFILFPTTAPRPPIGDATNLIYEFLRRIDSEMNAFPSLHVAFAVFHAAWCVKIISTISNRRIIAPFFWCWAILISFSTLPTKQHLFLDIPGGAILGAAAFAIFTSSGVIQRTLTILDNLSIPLLLDSGKITNALSSINDGIVNCYVLHSGNGLLCVDTGWRSNHISTEFERLGFNIENVSSILLTHSHWDHAGCLELFPYAEIFVSDAIAPAQLARLKTTRNKVTTIEENVKFSSGGFDIEMIHAPGHTIDSVFWIVDHKSTNAIPTRYVFTGDSIRLKDGIILPSPTILNSDNKSLKNSIEKLLKIKNIDFLLTSHHGFLKCNQTISHSETNNSKQTKKENVKMKILLIHPQNHLQRYETGIYGRNLRYAPLTMPTLKALIPDDISADVRIVDEMVEKLDFDISADLVGITAITGTATRAFQVADEFRKKGATVVLGGVHPTLRKEECLKHADSVVLGYAEKTWPELLRDFSKGTLKRVYQDPLPLDPSIIIPPDRSSIHKRDYIGWCTVEMGRGCSNKCEFCISHRFHREYIRRPIKSVIEEIKTLKSKTIFFLDPNLNGDREHAKEFFRELVKLRKWWVGCASLDIVDDLELLRLMAESGCKGLLMGFESVRPEALISSDKKNNIGRHYRDVVDTLHDHGIMVQACFVFGFDSDDPSIFEETAEFIINGRFDLPQISIYTPFPGTPVFDKLKKEGRILTEEWSLYNGQNVVFRPKRMSVEELAEGTDWVRREVHSWRALSKRIFVKPLLMKPVVCLSYLGFRFYQHRIKKASVTQRNILD